MKIDQCPIPSDETKNVVAYAQSRGRGTHATLDPRERTLAERFVASADGVIDPRSQGAKELQPKQDAEAKDAEAKDEEACLVMLPGYTARGQLCALPGTRYWMRHEDECSHAEERRTVRKHINQLMVVTVVISIDGRGRGMDLPLLRHHFGTYVCVGSCRFA